MRASVLYSSLLLFYALPAVSTRYHIHGAGPNNCIVSTGKEKPGEPVVTVPFDKACPPDTVVNVNPHVIRGITHGHVSGKSGLYIGKSKYGRHLEWVDKAYEWEFSPGAHSPFHVVSVPGTTEYWLNTADTKPVEVMRPPTHADVYWYFDDVYEDN
ncbi:hypothetical protein APHAL10511_002426 [Amanita phalloides]|nr:hypothetical protein APHAL10511_002426 [Amanita phalloides]